MSVSWCRRVSAVRWCRAVLCLERTIALVPARRNVPFLVLETNTQPAMVADSCCLSSQFAKLTKMPVLCCDSGFVLSLAVDSMLASSTSGQKSALVYADNHLGDSKTSLSGVHRPHSVWRNHLGDSNTSLSGVCRFHSEWRNHLGDSNTSLSGVHRSHSEWRNHLGDSNTSLSGVHRSHSEWRNHLGDSNTSLSGVHRPHIAWRNGAGRVQGSGEVCGRTAMEGSLNQNTWTTPGCHTPEDSEEVPPPARSSSAPKPGRHPIQGLGLCGCAKTGECYHAGARKVVQEPEMSVTPGTGHAGCQLSASQFRLSSAKTSVIGSHVNQILGQRLLALFSANERRGELRGQRRLAHTAASEGRRERWLALFSASERRKDLRGQRRLAHTAANEGRRERQKPPFRILFFGTDEFALVTLKALHQNWQGELHSVVSKLEVVTKSGRTLVGDFAAKAGLLTHPWPLDLQPSTFDLGVLASFGHLIPRRVLDLLPCGILNVHPSLLPRWRGASPILHTILHGDPVSGSSIMQLLPGRFDHGPLLAQATMDVPSDCTSLQLRDLLAEQGSQLLLQTLRNYEHLVPVPQSPYVTPTIAHKVTRAMACVDWENQTCLQIQRQFRALAPVMGGLRTELGGLVVRLQEMVAGEWPPPRSHDLPPGTPVYLPRQGLLSVRCQDGWVGFRAVTVRRPMSALAFHNGYLSSRSLPPPSFSSLPCPLFPRSPLPRAVDSP